MHSLFQKQVTLHDGSLFVLTRGLCLTATFLLASLLMLLWTGPANPWLLHWYADYLESMATVLLGLSLIGSLLLEDVLRRTTS